MILYLDANFFIFALFDQTKKGEKARELQREIIEGKKKAYTSVLTLDEVMWVLIKNKKEHLIRKIVEDIYRTPNVEVVEMPSLIPLHAIKFMEEYKMKPRDACHVAMMEQLKVAIIVTDDNDFDRIPQIKRIDLD